MKRRPNGAGSVTERKDGRWVARTSAPERRAFYGPTKEAATRKRAKYLREKRKEE